MISTSDVSDLLTVVMPTFNDEQFAAASIWSMRRFYPLLRIIIVDGGSGEESSFRLRNLPVDFVEVRHVKAEIASNVGAFLVRTPFVLFVSPDVKVIDKTAIPLLLDVLLSNVKVAETGAYGVKVIDWGRRIAKVGTEFTSSMELDATSGYFQMHNLTYFKQAGMYPFHFFYPGVEGFDPFLECDSDLAITNIYKEAGLRCMSPASRVPIIHWGGGSRYDAKKVPFQTWREENVTHITCNPLNDWDK